MTPDPFAIITEGSNSVQVISPDGQSRQKMQFYSTPGAGAIRARLRLVLSWDTDNTDLDLHVVTPDGEHAWYGNTVLKNSGALDMDVTTGYGPEIFAMPAPVHGRYQVYINYYGGRSETELTTAQLTLITDEGSVNEKQETFIFTQGELRQAGAAGEELLHGGGFDGLFFGDQFFQRRRNPSCLNPSVAAG